MAEDKPAYCRVALKSLVVVYNKPSSSIFTNRIIIRAFSRLKLFGVIKIWFIGVAKHFLNVSHIVDVQLLQAMIIGQYLTIFQICLTSERDTF